MVDFRFVRRSAWKYARTRLRWFFIGILLGPLGWIITLLLPEEGARCCECGGVIASGVKKCKHCGSDLYGGSRLSQPASQIIIQKTKTPRSPLQIQSPQPMLKIDPEIVNCPYCSCPFELTPAILKSKICPMCEKGFEL